MNIQLRLVQQLHDIRKVIQQSEKKKNKQNPISIIHSHQNRSQNNELPQIYESQPESENYSILFLKDTTRNTRRSFYLSRKKRQQSFQRDEEFFSNVSGRREQAQKTKILYSNMTGIDRAIKQIKSNKTQRESRAKIQSDHSNDVLGKVAKKNSDYTMNSSRSHIWHKVNPASQQSSIIEKKENEQRSCLTGAIKRRIVRHEEVKMPIQQIKYESLNQFIKIKPQILE
ncbi:hypothetical protein pb186bvf_009165 [Paramecium bursaria]